MNISWTIIMSGVYLTIVLLILSNISPDSYLAIKHFIIRLVNLDSSLITEILSKFARFVLSFSSLYNDKKYKPIEFVDKPYYKYPPYLKDQPDSTENINKNLIDIFSKENNYILSSRNTNKVNINQVQPYQEQGMQLNKNQENSIQKNSPQVQSNNNQVQSNNNQVQSNNNQGNTPQGNSNQNQLNNNKGNTNQGKTEQGNTDKIDISKKIKTFVDLFPKPEKFKEDSGNKSVDDIQSKLPKKPEFGTYKTYDVFSEKGLSNLY